jgi:hypothetical protein
MKGGCGGNKGGGHGGGGKHDDKDNGGFHLFKSSAKPTLKVEDEYVIKIKFTINPSASGQANVISVERITAK